MTTLNNDPNVIDLNLPGLGPDTIFAQAGGDFIRTSTLGGSLIFGEDDNDTITSLGPNDTIYGGNAEDSIRSQRTPALLFGEAGNDTIVAEARATMQGGLGEDFLQGTVEANLIFGNQDADTILGGSQRRDTLYGGKGNDAIGFFIAGGGNNNNNLGLTFSVSGLGGNEGSNLLFGNDGEDLVVGINQRDSLYGGKGNDTVRGVGSSNYLEGGVGNDRLSVTSTTQSNPFSQSAADALVTVGIEKATLMGGEGNDSLTGAIGNFNAGRSLFEGGVGNDTITVFAWQDTAKGGDGDDLIESRTTDVLLSTGGRSSFGGFAGKNFLDGEAGNDTLKGGFASDTLVGGVGIDSLFGSFSLGSGGDGDDTIDATSGVFTGTIPTPITLEGGIGNDRLVGNASVGTIVANVMNGGAGNDTVIFGTVRDSLSGDAAGDDFIYYATTVTFGASTTTNRISDFLGNNVIFGSDANDSISTGSGNDVLFGGRFDVPQTPTTVDGNDTLISGAGNDTLIGAFGNDYLSGGDGDDSLFGGPGTDTLIGGAGSDTFYYDNPGEGVSLVGGVAVTAPNPNSAPDQIEQFIVGQDKLVFQSKGFIELLPGVPSQPSRLPSAALLVKDPGQGEYVDAGGLPNGAPGFLVYESDTGRLLYDRDGIGGARAVHLATIANKPSLTVNDITVI